MAKQRRVAEIGHDGVWMQPLDPVVPYAGAYVLGEDECWIWLQRRPTWWQRWCVMWLLGWRWVERAPAAQVRTVVPAPAMPK